MLPCQPVQTVLQTCSVWTHGHRKELKSLSFYQDLIHRRKVMRSNLIYDALDTVNNRYLLCQLISKATRKFHKPNTRIQETMNDVLVRVGEADQSQEVITVMSGKLAEQQRRAA
jgi:hypothetical protein